MRTRQRNRKYFAIKWAEKQMKNIHPLFAKDFLNILPSNPNVSKGVNYINVNGTNVQDSYYWEINVDEIEKQKK